MNQGNVMDQLRGTRFMDWNRWSASLPADAQGVVLDTMQSIASHGGDPAVIDSDYEVRSAAEQLVTMPLANHFGITARTVRKNSQLRIVEKAVEAIIEQLRSASALPVDVTFRGKVYAVGVDDVTGVLNAHLEKAQSDLRIFVAASDVGTVSLLYGEKLAERFIQVNGRRVRLVTMGKERERFGFDSHTLALNDHESTIVIEDAAIVDVVHEMIANPRKRKKAFVQQQRELCASPYGESIAHAVDTLRETVFQHELGHFALLDRHGGEFRWIDSALMRAGSQRFKAFNELYADLYALQQIVRNADSDVEEATRAFQLWAMFRSAQNPELPHTVSNECVSNVLLSAVKTTVPALTVDWPLLRSRIESLLALLDKSIAEVGYHAKLNVVIRHYRYRRNPSPDVVNQSYAALVQDGAQKLRAHNSSYDQSKAERFVSVALVTDMLRSQPILGQTRLMNFQLDGIRYARSIDDWMMRELGLSREQVPFGAPDIRTIDPRTL